jgi:hypothetical protein
VYSSAESAIRTYRLIAEFRIIWADEQLTKGAGGVDSGRILMFLGAVVADEVRLR